MNIAETLKAAIKMNDQDFESWVEDGLDRLSKLPSDPKMRARRANDILDEIVNILNGTMDVNNHMNAPISWAELNDMLADLFVERGFSEGKLFTRIIDKNKRDVPGPVLS